MKNTTHTSRTHRTTTAATANKTASADEAFFSGETDPAGEARVMALEVITRLLIWIAEGANTQSRGARATVALYCVRPDLIGNITLGQIGDMAGISKQAAHTLARDFRVSIGF